MAAGHQAFQERNNIFVHSELTTGSINELFQAQSERTPDAIAVRFEHRTLSYRQLEQQARSLAGLLRQHGVSAGDRIGICVERGIELGVTVLGVLKAGAAYVPLDPAYPQQRLRLMVSDSGAKLVLVSRQHRDLFGTSPSLLEVESIIADAPVGPAQDIEGGGAGPGQLAYLIYTSGSTGTPKGVAMPHRALANLIRWQLQHPDLKAAARTVQFTPLSFDVHFQEFFGTWTSGGTLHFIADETRRDPARLLAFINQHAIERLYLPFVALQQLLEAAVNYGPMPTSLTHIITAGEQLQVNRPIIEFFKRMPHCRLHNHYGPSETHVVTTHTLPQNIDRWPTLPPIGKPISNTRILLLDAGLEPVASGDSGELCISGDSLADGYWQRDELTAQRFIAHPLALGGRLYRSGDLARMDDAGDLHYLGRLDGQVKIRGHRVETGEIESHLRQHPEVRDCAVVADSESGGDRKLLAYLVLDAQSARHTDKLEREQLEQWQDVWDGTYQQGTAGSDRRFDTSGWNSSYTGRPLPEDEMRRWVDGTVARILERKPRRVLEIGAGTGLILFAVAPHCDYYHATDYSPVSIETLQAQLSIADDLADKTRASVLAADQLERLHGERYDTVVLNSVTQHFVSVDYLLRVISQAVELLAGSGSIFIGDVTNRGTRRLFFNTVECFRASSGDGPDSLRAKVELRLGEDQELVIDPMLFFRLAEEVEGIRAVSVQLKPGDYDNELSQYRYDVVLEVGAQRASAHSPKHWLEWQPGLEMAAIMQHLESTADGIGVRAIPNARLTYAAALAHCLDDPRHETIAGLRQCATAAASNARAMHPDAFLDLQRSHHCRVQLLPSANPACFDALIDARDDGGCLRPELDRTIPLRHLASQPLNVSAMAPIVQELRAELSTSLPDFMHPAKYLVLQSLPLTPSGKLDRRALPTPSTRRPMLEQEFVAPRTELESSLASIWAALLELDEVGVNDNFFELGGNSILSLRLGLEIRRRLGREVPVVILFQYPTVATLASYLAEPEGQAPTAKAEFKERASKQKMAFARGKRLSKVNNR
jgi:amino acid adenylation domain-containing protein